MPPIYHLLSEHTLGAVAADPSWITLTGAINGVAGAIVGAAAAPGTFLPKATTWTHCTQDTCVKHLCPSTTFLIVTVVKVFYSLNITISDTIHGATGLFLAFWDSLLLIRFTNQLSILFSSCKLIVNGFAFL